MEISMKVAAFYRLFGIGTPSENLNWVHAEIADDCVAKFTSVVRYWELISPVNGPGELVLAFHG